MPDPAESLPVVPKSSSQPGMQPTPAELVPAELALNAGDGILYGRMADGTVLPVRARPLGGYGGGNPGTFDGGCTPPVVTEAGEVIPGVVSQADDGAFQISSIACNPSGATCKWGVTFFQPARQWGAYHLRGEVRDPETGATKWTFIAVGVWRSQDSGQWHTLEISTAEYWREVGAGGDVVWSPQSPSSGWQPTGRYVMAVGNSVSNDIGPRTVTPVYVFAGPGPVPSCACAPPPPPDYGSWSVVDDGEDTRYDCVGGNCVARQARKYAVRFRFYPPDGVTSFATEAEALARAAALTSQDGQYATLSACQSACVAGAWVVTPSGTVTRYRCTGGNCNAPNSQQYDTYTVAFSAGTAVTGPVSNGGSFATQQEANAWVASRTNEMVTAHPYATLGDCQIALAAGACAPVTYRCVTTTSNGVLSHTCTAVQAADLVAVASTGARLFNTLAGCEARCGTPPVRNYITGDSWRDANDGIDHGSPQVIFNWWRGPGTAQLLAAGYEDILVTLGVQTFEGAGITVEGVCTGALGPIIQITRPELYPVPAGWPVTFTANINTCVPNPAP